jgi:hypothetical protein
MRPEDTDFARPAKAETVIKTEVALRPFRVPNYVLAECPTKPREFGFTEPPKYHLSELSIETLEALCYQFRKDVLAKASSDTAGGE